MRVKDLIAELSKLDPMLDVICYSEDEAHQIDGKDVQCLDIQSVNRAIVVRSRDEDFIGRIQFDNEKGRPIALIQVSGDF